jgi:endoglucanase
MVYGLRDRGWGAVFAGFVSAIAVLLTASCTSAPVSTGGYFPVGIEGAISTAGLRVAGNQIQNGAGQAVQLHGVNRSSWEYACIDPSWGATHDGNADQAEVTAMKAWNINVVRVTLNEDCWLGINGVAVAAGTYQQDVASYVSLLSQNNIATIVNLHFSAPGTILAGTYSGGDQFPMPDRDHSPSFWSGVAAAFKSDSHVLFEPYNEPFPDDNHGGTTAAAWTCWRDGGTCPAVSGFPDYQNAGMQELVSAIRGAGASNPIIVTGTNWGSEVSKWQQYKPSDPLNQLVVGWHSYGDGLSCQTATCWTSTLTPLMASYPLEATEIGEFDCKHSYVDQVMAFLDSKGAGYTAWAWGPYNCAKDPALITNWAGTPTQTYGQGFHDHLMAIPIGSSATATPAKSPKAYVELFRMVRKQIGK